MTVAAKTIGESCEVGDGTHSKIKREDSGILYLTCRNFKEGRIDKSKVYFISEENFAKYFQNGKKALICPQPGDLVFSIIGTIGEPYLIRPSDHFGISSSVAIVRPHRDEIDPQFLYYWMRAPAFQGALFAIKGGVAQGYVSLEMIRSLPAPNIHLPTQRKIAGILSAYDDLIENNLRRIRILEEMAQSLYREWFVHFRYPGHESVPLTDSPLGPIPQGWEVKKIGELADQMRRGVAKGKLDEPTPYVGLEHIPRISLALNDWDIVEELGSNKLTFEPGEVLFGKIRPYFHKVSIAPFEGICSADTIVIRSKTEECRALVISCVFSEAFVAHASATANGAKMPRADWKVLKDYQVIVPDGELLKKFSSVFEDVDFQTRNLIRRIQTLRQTRDLLLPKFLSPSN